MATLTTKKRKSLKKSQFALPGERKYPVNDKTHAVLAKGRATQQYNKGKLSKASLEKIEKKANAVLNKGKKSPSKPAKKKRRPNGGY